MEFLFNRFELAGIGTGGTGFPNLRGGHDDGARLLLQLDEDAIPVIETFAAWLAMRCRADVAASAAVALVSADSGQAHAGSVGVVTLQRGRSLLVAVTGRARVFRRFTPVVGTALVATTSSETLKKRKKNVGAAAHFQ